MMYNMARQARMSEIREEGKRDSEMEQGQKR
jgi:hypothetical protein